MVGMSPWLLSVCLNLVMKELKMGKGRVGVGLSMRGESGHCLLNADDLVLCDQTEENLKVMVGQYVEIC